MSEFIDAHPWLLPACIIFFGRICDVTLGTLRIIFVSKGERSKAPIVGFFEVLIWVCVISQIFQNAADFRVYLAYAAGYATGNYVGITIENKIAFGYQLFRIYTNKDGAELTAMLNQKGFGSTLIKGEGAVSEVHIIEAVVNRRAVKAIVEILNQFDSNIFYLIEDVRSKQKGIFTYSSAAGAPRLGK
jgi:uncharacterized protein YebE (UPF0316 family)